jgi:hypothetical protein
MIAPIRQSDPETTEVRRRLRQARQVIASTLLRTRRTPVVQAPPLPHWQAWLFATWIVVVVAAYGASMLGLW